MTTAVLARLLHGAAVVALGVLVLLAVGAAVLALRLSQGPMDVSWAVRTGLSLAGAKEVQVGQATLSWTGWHGGAGSPVQFTVRRLDVTGKDGQPQLSAQQGEATLSAAGLLKGKVEPSTAVLDGVHLRAARDAAGQWHVLGSDGSSSSSGGDALGSTLDQLRRVSLHNATVDVDDARLGHWQLSGVTADLTRDENGSVHGEAAADAVLGGLSAHVAVRATVQPGGASRIELSTGPLDPAALAAIGGPDLAQAAMLDARVSLSGTAVLDKDFHPVSATVDASAGAGWLNLSGAALPFQGISASLEAQWADGVLARVPRLHLEAAIPSPAKLPGTGPVSHLVVDGQAERAADRVNGTVTVELDRLAFSDLPALWPPDAGRNARAWITENITAGTARDAKLQLSFDAPPDLSDMHMSSVSARLGAEDATVWWLRPVPPVEHVDAILTWTEADSVDIRLQPGRVPATEQTPAGPLTVQGGSIRLRGLSTHDQNALIDLDITGTVPATIALLKHERLHLLSRRPVPFTSSSGNNRTHFSLDLPLKRDVDIDDARLGVDARLTRLRLDGLVAGRNLADGDVKLHVANDGLDVAGQATVGGLPGTLQARLDFRAGPPTQVTQSVGFTTRATAAQLEGIGAPVSSILTGTPTVTVSYKAQRSGAGEVSAHADLTAAGVNALGWRKAPGVAARLDAHVVLDHDKLRAVDLLRAEGPDLSVHGRAEPGQPGQPAALLVEGAEIGRTRLSGRVEFGPTLTVSAGGPVLDVATLLEDETGPASRQGTKTTARPSTRLNRGGTGKAGTPYVVDAAFGRVLLGGNRSLSGVSAHAESDGTRLRRASLTTTGPERLVATLVPDGGGRALHAHTTDGGALLRILDLSDRFETGEVALEARFDDTLPDSPLTGTLEVGRLHILGAPVVGKVLQAATIYGIADALRGPGLVFSRFQVPFLFADNRLDLRDARLLSASLGITASGMVDLQRRLVDMKGTVVPAYAVNAAPGRIPVIGRLFTAGPGGGLFAASWAVNGKLDDPSFSINPLMLLAPGAMRRLFGAQD